MRNLIPLVLASAQIALSVHGFHFGKPEIPEGVQSDAPYGQAISQSISKNGFGMTVEQDVYANKFTETTVTAPLLPFHLNHALHTEQMKKMTDHHKKLQSANRESDDFASPVYTCGNHNPFGDSTTAGSFLPSLGGVVNDDTRYVTFEGHCFQEITMFYQKTSDTTFDLSVTRQYPRNSLCNDVVLFANTEITHMEVFYVEGTHKYHFDMPSLEA